MSSRLILVRHSLPDLERDRPARDWKLSCEGKNRARRLADGLVQFQPARLFPSPEPKAVETAEALAEKLQLPVTVTNDLHEHDRSGVSFLTRSEFEAAVQKLFENPDALMFGHETANEAYERFSEAVFSALAEDQASTTVMVSHGTVMSLFISRVTGQLAFPIWSTLGLPCYITLNVQPNRQIAMEKVCNEFAL